MQAILIHGNGGGTPNDNWFPYVKEELEKLGISVKAPQFPDADLARSSYWLPFLKELGADSNTLLIGHSSGAIAAMRYAEEHPVLGSVLVGAYCTDLGYEKEKLSGYFDKPWNWKAIKKNQRWILQFASLDDPWIPIEEARALHAHLGTEYYEYSDQGHFGGDYHKTTFPELVEAIKHQLMVDVWQKHLEHLDWRKMITQTHPKKTPCGPIYELPNPIERPNEDFAIADMREVGYTEPHYHPETEVYFILQGSGLVVVGGEETVVQKGSAILIPSNTAHFVIPREDLVLAVVNTPPFRAENVRLLTESHPQFKYNHSQFESLRGNCEIK